MLCLEVISIISKFSINIEKSKTAEIKEPAKLNLLSLVSKKVPVIDIGVIS